MRSATAVVILAIILVGFVGVAAYYVWRAHNVVKLPLGIGLSEELGPTPYLTYAEVGELKPGMVFQTVADKQGWQLKQKDTTLYDVLKLTDVDLAVNDVIAPHMYDWYFDGENDYVWFALPTVWKLSVSEPYGTIATRFIDYDTSRLVGAATPHTGVALLQVSETTGLFPFGIDVYTTTCIQGYFRGLGHRGYANVGELQNKWLDVVFGYHVIDANNTYVFLWVDGQQQSLPNNGLYNYTDNRFGIDTSAQYLRIGWSGYNEPDEWLKGKVSYVALWHNKLLSNSEVQQLEQHMVSALEVLVDPTFYNGTQYINLINASDTGTPYGGVVRLPAEQQWLWLVKGLKSDNEVHFEWFPEGTIIKIKDSSGNVVREFTIDGTPVNSDNQIEDFAISLDSTTIPGATIEAYVPALAVRVYGPYGATAEILGDDGTVYGSKVIGPDGYADIPLTHALSNAKVVIAASELVQDKLDVRVDEDSDGTITVTVTDDKGVLIPDMLVRIADPSGVVIYAGMTGQDGKVTFKPDRPLPSITVEVSGVWDGVIQYTKKEVQLSANVEAATVTNTPTSTYGGSYWWWVLTGLGLILLLAVAVTVGRRR